MGSRARREEERGLAGPSADAATREVARTLRKAFTAARAPVDEGAAWTTGGL